MTPAQLLEAKPGLRISLSLEKKREEAFRGRCIAKMSAIVKAAKKGEPCEVTDADITDIFRFLRGFSDVQNAARLVSMMSKHAGMIHGG